MDGKQAVAYLHRLVGNPNAYAVQHDDGSWHPVREAVTDDVLKRHLLGEVTVGTYVVNGETARTLVFDVDDASKEAVTAIGQALVDRGVPRRGIGVEFSGRKGYHVWVVATEPMPARDLRRLGKAVLVDTGLAVEVFPKQDVQRDLGNLVKLPWALHRVSKKRSEWVGPHPLLLPPAMLAATLADVPEVVARTGATGPDPFPCMQTIQEGVVEGGRNMTMFHLAVMLRRGGLADDLLMPVLETVNARNKPPLEEHELLALFESSRNSGPLCRQLGDDVACGDACILHRTPGLYTRPGTLKHAAAGERVVFEVATRDDDKVTLEHPDAVAVRAKVKKGKGE